MCLDLQVKNYFNTTGFERWRKIYGETDEVCCHCMLRVRWMGRGATGLAPHTW